MSIGENIRERRLAKQMTQEDFAEQIAVTRSYISKIELDQKDLMFRKAILIAKVLGCTVDDLCREEGE